MTTAPARPTLGELVGDGDDFLTTSWRREARVFNPASTWTEALTVTDLEQVLACGLLGEPYLEMVEGGRHLPVRRYTTVRPVGPTALHTCADPHKIAQEIAAGATLLLRNLEHWHRPTAELTGRLQRELGRKVESFFFLTPPERQALPAHRDDADVFVLQVQGAKDWTLHHPPTDGHWAPGTEHTPGAIALRTTLTPGDVLYVPRGAAHCAVGCGTELSAHLSLTVREVGSAQLHDTLHALLAEGMGLAPRPVDDDGLGAAAQDLLDHHRGRIATLTAADLVAAARTIMAAQADPAPGLATA
ncbi:cupin domain-containing protein [Kitasatospora sp. NPDC085879]|uniref:JmjC domain-containing protein n=1 Tax=Kitasatospora sp. NPDC085879 TaxID=3154769 RepID=UPI0034285EEA